MEYRIPFENLEKLEKKITSIRNKCEAYGIEFHYEKSEPFYEDVTIDGNVVSCKFVTVEVEGKAVLNGWRYVASLTKTPAGNLIEGNGCVEVPEKYYNSDCYCEHCNTRRNRKYLYIVQNEESGEFRQVGQTCLKDYTRGMDASYVAKYESFFHEMEEAVSPSYGGGCVQYVNLADFLPYVAETVRLFGYVRSDNEIGAEPTGQKAFGYYLAANGRIRDKKVEKETLEEMGNLGFSIEGHDKTISQLCDWVNSQAETSNYFHNLKVTFALDYVTAGSYNLIASAFAAWDRELDYRAKKAERDELYRREQANKTHSEYQGSLGGRVEFKPFSCKVLTSWETMYGVSKLVEFVDERGNVYIWKTSTWMKDSEVVKVTGSVKEYGEFRGIKQTVLTRCRLAYAD